MTRNVYEVIRNLRDDQILDCGCQRLMDEAADHLERLLAELRHTHELLKIQRRWAL